MMAKTKKFILFFIFILLFVYIGNYLYKYYFDLSLPIIEYFGIENNSFYSGNINCKIEVSDEYKVKYISIYLDNKIIIDKNIINNKHFSIPLNIPTVSLDDGKHNLKILAVDASKNENLCIKEIPFFVDNSPLEIKLIKVNEPIKIFQGNTLRLNFQSNKSNIIAYAKTLSYNVPCVLESEKSRVFECFIPIATDEIPNEYLVSINIEDKVGNTSVIEATYEVVSQIFKKQTIQLKKKMENLGSRSDFELEEIIKSATEGSPSKKLWVGRFYSPCVFKNISTEFGVIRTSMERGKYRHDAVDLNANPKSPVWACQDGVIVAKDNFTNTGNTVVIDHGCGIITLYGHLETFANINVGDFIKKGNIIGTVGMTGYATGYHLHWEMRIYGIKVNPMEWIKDDL